MVASLEPAPSSFSYLSSSSSTAASDLGAGGGGGAAAFFDERRAGGASADTEVAADEPAILGTPPKLRARSSDRRASCILLTVGAEAAKSDCRRRWASRRQRW